MADRLRLTVKEIPLRWDGGNFTHNGAGTGIATRRILKDNPGMTEAAIRRIMLKELGIERLVLIDEEPGDVTGHVDGTVRFLGSNTAAIAEYPSRYKKANEWLDRLVGFIRDETKDEIQLIRIPNGDIENRTREGIPSARGNHLNFLRAGNAILMPCYGCHEDEKAIMVLENCREGISVRPIARDSITELSRLGGVFNCISWGM